MSKEVMIRRTRAAERFTENDLFIAWFNGDAAGTMARTESAARLKLLQRIGDEAFEVEWCYDLPCVEGSSDADIDRAKYRRVIVPTRDEAMALAKEVYPLDKFGAVHVTPVRFEDPHGDTPYAGIKSQFRWEPIADVIEYSGD